MHIYIKEKDVIYGRKKQNTHARCHFTVKKVEGGSAFRIVPSILVFFVMGATTFVVTADVDDAVPNGSLAAAAASVVVVVVAVPSHVVSSNTLTTANDERLPCPPSFDRRSSTVPRTGTEGASSTLSPPSFVGGPIWIGRSTGAAAPARSAVADRREDDAAAGPLEGRRTTVVDEGGKGGDAVTTNAARRRVVAWWNGDATIEQAVDEATTTKSRRVLLMVVEVVLLLSSERRDDDEVVVEWISADAERWTIEDDDGIDCEWAGAGRAGTARLPSDGGVWFVITHVASTRMGGCLPRLCIPTSAINAN